MRYRIIASFPYIYHLERRAVEMAVVSIVITGMTMNMLIAAIDLSAGSMCTSAAAIAAESMSTIIGPSSSTGQQALCWGPARKQPIPCY